MASTSLCPAGPRSRWLRAGSLLPSQRRGQPAAPAGSLESSSVTPAALVLACWRFLLVQTVSLGFSYSAVTHTGISDWSFHSQQSFTAQSPAAFGLSLVWEGCVDFCQQPSVLPRTVQLAGPQGRTSSVSFQLFPFCFFLFVSVNCAFSGFSFNLFRRVTNPLPVRGCDTTAPSLVLWKVCNCLVNLAGRMNTHGHEWIH